MRHKYPYMNIKNILIHIHVNSLIIQLTVVQFGVTHPQTEGIQLQNIVLQLYIHKLLYIVFQNNTRYQSDILQYIKLTLQNQQFVFSQHCIQWLSWQPQPNHQKIQAQSTFLSGPLRGMQSVVSYLSCIHHLLKPASKISDMRELSILPQSHLKITQYFTQAHLASIKYELQTKSWYEHILHDFITDPPKREMHLT